MTPRLFVIQFLVLTIPRTLLAGNNFFLTFSIREEKKQRMIKHESKAADAIFVTKYEYFRNL